MIGLLEGTLADIEGKVITLNVAGVGYRIFTTVEIVETIRGNTGKLTFWTHMAVRENSSDLFGFLTKTDRDFFELLITIPGIGPKSALTVMNVVAVETLISAISTNDVSYLTKVSGIGRKTADKIILELKGKIGPSSGETTLKEDGDVLEALRSLGYGERETRDALKKIPNSIIGASNRVKEALKILGKN